jgi:hypothetical protein
MSESNSDDYFKNVNSAEPENSPSLGDLLGETAAPPPPSESAPPAGPAAALQEEETIPSPSPEVPAPMPGLGAALETPELSPAKRGMTTGQAALQQQRAITLEMMREEYRAVFGNDRKAPKAKAYDAAGLTTIRLQQGDEAFLRKLREEIIPRNVKVYENKTRKRPMGLGPMPSMPAPALGVASTNYRASSSNRPENLRAKADELLRRAAIIEQEQMRKAAIEAAEQARREELQELRKRAERNLRDAMNGQNVPSDLLNGYVKLLQSEYKDIPAKAFKDICSFCAAHATRKHSSKKVRSLNRYTRRYRS